MKPTKKRSRTGEIYNNIKLEITAGDLAGKYKGRTGSAGQRHLLNAIPGPGSFESTL